MSKSSETAAREHRLAAKLRENLRRRKAQARARATGAGQAAPEETDASPDGEVPLNPDTDSDSRH
jgi:hypothetical protein